MDSGRAPEAVKRPFFDSSFLLKLYVNEPDSEASINLLRQLGVTPVIDLLTDVEMASAILRRLKGAEGQAAYQGYLGHRSGGAFRVVATNAGTFALAKSLNERYAASFGLRTLDSIHLASALLHGADGMITTDKELAAAARACGLEVLP